jgi:hypothetical protein
MIDAGRKAQRELPLGLLLGFYLLVSIAGCATQRPELGALELRDRQSRLIATTAAQRDYLLDRSVRRLERKRDRQMAMGLSGPITLDFLIVSSGAAWGAFGAGLLNGWGTVDNAHPEARPEFDFVTGVSTGVLIGLYAVTDRDDRYRQIELLYRQSDPGWVEQRGLVPFWPGNRSLFDNSGLNAVIREELRPTLLEEISVALNEDRTLLAATADLDMGRARIWDLTIEARRALETNSTEQLHRIVSAAVAVPAAFPAVEIDGSLHADAGAIQSLFGMANPEQMTNLIYRWRSRHPDDPLPRLRFWVIVNNTIGLQPTTVQPGWSAVAFRALETRSQTGNVSPLNELWLSALLLKEQLDVDVEVKWIAVPNDFEVPDTDQFFDPVVTNALADLGHRLGADPGSWRTVPPREWDPR